MEPGVQHDAPARPVAIAQLAQAAYRLSAADARLRGRATRELGAVSLPHARALKSLAEAGPMTVGTLAERVETTAAAVTQLVDGLVRAGFVIRERNATGDRRVVSVSITDTGRARHVERQGILDRALAEILADLDTAQAQAAVNVMIRLASLYDNL